MDFEYKINTKVLVNPFSVIIDHDGMLIIEYANNQLNDHLMTPIVLYFKIIFIYLFLNNNNNNIFIAGSQRYLFSCNIYQCS